MQHFKRWEKKYLITDKQANLLKEAISTQMKPDKFDSYWVQNIYFDTKNWDVIHTSMEKPYYKEKMRLRYYCLDNSTPDHVFLELKKKYAGIVYKRRVSLPLTAVEEDILVALKEKDSQMARELGFYLQSKNVYPKMFISYRRQAFAGIENQDLRLTFDTDIAYRTHDLHFTKPGVGKEVLPKGYQLMEIKTATSIPLWLAELCSKYGIFTSSYSKYATCFLDHCAQIKSEKMVIPHV